MIAARMRGIRFPIDKIGGPAFHNPSAKPTLKLRSVRQQWPPAKFREIMRRAAAADDQHVFFAQLA